MFGDTPNIYLQMMPAPPNTCVFVTYNADWDEDWPERPEDITITELKVNPIIGFWLESVDEDGFPLFQALYLDEVGGVSKSFLEPLDWGFENLGLGIWATPVDMAALEALAIIVCWHRIQRIRLRRIK